MFFKLSLQKFAQAKNVAQRYTFSCPSILKANPRSRSKISTVNRGNAFLAVYHYTVYKGETTELLPVFGFNGLSVGLHDKTEFETKNVVTTGNFADSVDEDFFSDAFIEYHNRTMQLPQHNIPDSRIARTIAELGIVVPRNVMNDSLIIHDLSREFEIIQLPIFKSHVGWNLFSASQ